MDVTKNILHKQFEIKVLEKRKDGGRIAINTSSLDRDRDRVMPAGARVDDYMRNPVVQWAHDYKSPWSTIGRTRTMEITPEAIIADFELRPAANEADPQNIVLLLWNGEWVRTASIGFMPSEGKPNAEGGTDFTIWSLLEWSIVPIPSNQDALRLAVKGLNGENADDIWATAALDVVTNPRLTEEERTRMLAGISDLRSVLSTPAAKSPPCRMADETEADCRSRKISEIMNEDPNMGRDQAVAMAISMCSQECESKNAPDVGGAAPGRAWIRTLTVEADGVPQTVFAAFHRWTVDVPEDAEILQPDADGECVWVPDPDAGKTKTLKEVQFVPPIEYDDDATYSIGGKEIADEELVMFGDDWTVKSLSEIQLILPIQKVPVLHGLGHLPTLGAGVVTRKTVARVLRHSKRLFDFRDASGVLTKRGRVLSAKSEDLIRSAQAKIENADGDLNQVLSQLDAQPEQESAHSHPNPISTYPQAAAHPATALILDADSERDLAETLLTLTHTLKEVYANE